MQIAFYKGRTRLFNRLVSWFLRGPYSHCELVLSSVDGVSTCASASYMDAGVRIKHMRLDPARWDLLPIQGSVSDAYRWLDLHEHDPYDVLGLLGFVWRRQQGAQRKWFCSEAVAAMLGLHQPWRIDPMVLYCLAQWEAP